MAIGTKTNPASLPGTVSSGVYSSSAPSLSGGDQIARQMVFDLAANGGIAPNALMMMGLSI